MSIKIDISVCRVCCKSEANHSILQYAKKFHYCTALEVLENDGLPAKICDSCLERMKIAVEFKKKSESSDRQLRSFIATVNSQFHKALESSGDDEDDGDDIVEKEPEDSDKYAKNESFLPGEDERNNSALGSCRDASSPEITETLDVSIVEQEDQLKPEENVQELDEKALEAEQKQEQEKFRAVAVIQEKPFIKPEKDFFEVVEVDYEENMLQQDDIIDEQESANQPTSMDEGDELEENDQVIYISIPDYQTARNTIVNIEENSADDFAQSVKVAYASSLISESSAKPVKISESSLIVEPKNTPSKIPGKFECVQCEKFFSTKTNLNRHLQSHNGNKPYVCRLCQKGFTQNGSLKQHILLHQNLRPYVCSVCDQGFTQQKSLTFHMRRHTNEKPFVCEHCQYAFRQKDGLKRHLLVKHTPKDAKAHLCNECGKSFQTRYSLAMHEKRHHAAKASSGP